MSYMREREQSRSPAAGEARLGVARMADRVCEATRQAALEGVGSALSMVAEQSPALPEAIRDIADRALARVAIMQTEMDRFLAASRGRHCAHGARTSPSTKREKMADCIVPAFVALEKQRTKCHGEPRRQTIFK